MLVHLKNLDEEKSLLIVGIAKEKSGFEALTFTPEKPTTLRSVLRPGEDGKYNLDEDYCVGMEIL